MWLTKFHLAYLLAWGSGDTCEYSQHLLVIPSLDFMQEPEIA